LPINIGEGEDPGGNVPNRQPSVKWPSRLLVSGYFCVSP
jgi:hypothetical protein